MKEITNLKCDVLVIGGGMAGCFAAIAAREKDSKVILADKGYVSSSGQTPYAGTFMMFDKAKDHKSEWIQCIREGGDYVCNQAWLELVLDRSKECYEDLLNYGVQFRTKEEMHPPGEKDAGPPPSMGVCDAVIPTVQSLAPQLRKQVLKSGAEICDRLMIVDLIMEQGVVCGAVGFNISDGVPVAIQAKAVIIATGASAFKPMGWPISNLTADGDMMAYRVGASITGKEFIDTHLTTVENPASNQWNPVRDLDAPRPPVPFMITADGQEFIPSGRGLNLGAEFEVHCGRAPIYRGMPHDRREVVSEATCGMSTHKAEGVWPVGMDCGVGIPGLYAAGDSLGVMLSGAAYAAIGLALTGSAVLGKLAGETAGNYALETKEINATTVEALFEKIYEPINRISGFKPEWVIRLLQNTMIPYFVMMIKHEDRLLAALSQVEFYKNYLVPKLYAKDAHELRLA